MSPKKPKAILRLGEVLSRVGLSRSGLYQAIKEGRFPKSVPLGPRAVGWLEQDIEDWITERVDLRRLYSDVLR